MYSDYYYYDIVDLLFSSNISPLHTGSHSKIFFVKIDIKIATTIFFSSVIDTTKS
jgi:hypothetical protein